MARNTLSRTLHDLGLSAWFGGTLANAVALNAAAGEAGSDSATGRVANAGWDRWTPVNAAAIGAHLVGSVGQLGANKERVAQQQGVAGMSALKTLLTAAALGATAYSRVLGQRVSAAGEPAVEARHQAQQAHEGARSPTSPPPRSSWTPCSGSSPRSPARSWRSAPTPASSSAPPRWPRASPR